MDLKRQKRTMFGVAVDMYIGVLNGANWPNYEISDMKVVCSFKEGAELVALGASACEVSRQQRLPARIVANGIIANMVFVENAPSPPVHPCRVEL